MLRSSKLKQDDIYNHYNIASTLGKGGYATVYLGEHIQTSTQYAIKAISKDSLEPKIIEEVQAEIDVYEATNHRHVANLKEIIETDSAYCLVMELISGGELFDQIAKRKTYSESDCNKVAKQILEGVKHLHDLDFVHRDLKPENLLIASDPKDAEVEVHIKLVDFGLTRRLTSDRPHLVECIGTTLYMAPEVVKRRKEDEENQSWGYGKPADVWSIGVIIYIMLCGWAPFNAFDEEDIFELIEAGEFAFPPDDYLKLSDSAKDLLRAMLEVDPLKRLSVEQALEHPWVKGESEDVSLDVTIAKVKQFQARRKFKGAIKAVEALKRFGVLKTKELNVEESRQVEELYSQFKAMLSHENKQREEIVVVESAPAAEPSVVKEAITKHGQPSKYSVHPATLKRLGLGAEDAELAAEYFHQWDTDGNEMIDSTEFFAALSVLFEGKGKSLAFIERFANMHFTSADLNRNGTLSWMEFLELYNRLKRLF